MARRGGGGGQEWCRHVPRTCARANLGGVDEERGRCRRCSSLSPRPSTPSPSASRATTARCSARVEPEDRGPVGPGRGVGEGGMSEILGTPPSGSGSPRSRSRPTRPVRSCSPPARPRAGCWCSRRAWSRWSRTGSGSPSSPSRARCSASWRCCSGGRTPATCWPWSARRSASPTPRACCGTTRPWRSTSRPCWRGASTSPTTPWSRSGGSSRPASRAARSAARSTGSRTWCATAATRSSRRTSTVPWA